MGGSLMKGGYGNSNQHGTNGNRKRYLLTLIILLVFGGAVMGLMRTQKLRDRRIFDILIKEKKNQILSLQLHLQNEREHVQDGKLKAEELKMKVYSLRAQKKELHGKILEMQSAIMSLKEEQKTLESAYEEQQNENKLLRDKCSQNPQLESLTELVRQKEAEIDELHRQTQLPAKGSSVSKDDPSTLPAKINLPGSKVSESGENPINSERSTRNDTSTFVETKGSIQTRDNSEDRKFSENTKTAFGRSGHVYDLQSGIESKKTGSETVMTENNEEQKPSDEVRDGKEIKTVHRGGVKLEARNNGRNRLGGNSGYLKRSKGKRWSTIRKETQQKGNFGSDEAKIAMTDQHFEKHDERANSKAYARKITRENIEDSPPGNISLQNNASQVKTEYMSQNEATEVNEASRQQELLANLSSVTSTVSLNEVQHYKTEGMNSGSSNKQDTMIQHHTEMENGNENYYGPGIKSEVSTHQDDADVKDSEESEMVTNGSEELEYDVQKKNEEEAHTDEPEF